jgi:hypothetical protein
MKHIRTLHLTIIVLILFSCLSARAQHIDSVLAKLDREYKQEKIYLHFDRSAYTQGETIWFKAYLFTGSFPSLVSRNVYAELLDDKGRVLQKKTMPVVNSSAFNSFDLPLNLTSSVVYVRAYTKWMLNFDSSYLFTKAIPVLTLKQTTAKSTPSSQKTNPVATTDQPNYFLQFFPEGGDLVQDVESRIAFKSTNNKGMPINISGEVTDNKGNKIVSFTSVHDGMGTFELVPKAGSTYKATWKDGKGKIHETLLPTVKLSKTKLNLR